MISQSMPRYIITEQSGFTLIETMVAMTVAAIVMAATVSSYIAQQRIQISQEQLVGVQQNIRTGITRMLYDIRMAGCNPNEAPGHISCAKPGATAAAPPGIHTAESTQFGFSMDLNGNGDCNDTGENITYNIYDVGGIDNLGRKSPTNNVSQAEHIEAIEFLYTLKNGSQLLTPSAAQFDDITGVQVSLLGRTAQEDRDYTNTKTYTPASGTPWDLNAGAGVVPNDKYRRQLLSVQANLRNMRL